MRSVSIYMLYVWVHCTWHGLTVFTAVLAIPSYHLTTYLTIPLDQNYLVEITQKKVVFLWIDHQPIIKRLFYSNSYIVRPFVNRSAFYYFILIRLISISFGCTLDLNQWYLIPICLVCDDIKGLLLLTRFWVPILYSYAFDTDPVPLRSKSVFSFNSSTRFLADTSSLIPCDKAMYSVSKVDKAISVWSLELQYIGTPTKLISSPVLLLIETGSCLSSATKRLAKSVLANRFNFDWSRLGDSNNPFRLSLVNSVPQD